MTYHNYIFISCRPSFYLLTPVKQKQYKAAFSKTLTDEKNVTTHCFATLGLNNLSQILFWFQAQSIDDIQTFLNTLMHTDLGNHLIISYTLFGIARKTQYSETSVIHLDTERKGGKYLVIYPFTKTKEWHMIPYDDRKKLMEGHIRIGKKYPQIEQILLYSYGIDNSEFIVSYETDDLSAFQSLVMELRSDKVRAYTLSDTPIFTCVYKTPDEVVAFL